MVLSIGGERFSQQVQLLPADLFLLLRRCSCARVRPQPDQHERKEDRGAVPRARCHWEAGIQGLTDEEELIEEYRGCSLPSAGSMLMSPRTLTPVIACSGHRDDRSVVL